MNAKYILIGIAFVILISLVLYSIVIRLYRPIPDREFYVRAWECYYLYKYSVYDCNYNWRNINPSVKDKLSCFLKEYKRYRKTKAYAYIGYMKGICNGKFFHTIPPVNEDPEVKYTWVIYAFDKSDAVRMEMIEYDIVVDTECIKRKMKEEYDNILIEDSKSKDGKTMQDVGMK